MTDKPYYDERPATMLRSWVLTQMMRGAGYAAILLVGIGLALYALHLVALLLPEQSKQMPSPYGFLIETHLSAVV